MFYKTPNLAVAVLTSVLVANCCGQLSKEGTSPLDKLPAHIERVTHFGQRADWSRDGAFYSGDIVYDLRKYERVQKSQGR